MPYTCMCVCILVSTCIVINKIFFYSFCAVYIWRHASGPALWSVFRAFSRKNSSYL